MFSRFRKDVSGHFAIIAGVSAPVFLMATGLAIDYSMWTRQQAKLQGIADATAIASAREFHVVNAELDQVRAMADAFAEAQLVDGDAEGPLSVTTTPTMEPDGETVATVQVDVSQPRHSYLTASLSSSFQPLSATAVAKVVGGGPLCALALDPSSPGALSLEEYARITAPDCVVQSNSESASGIDVADSAQIIAAQTCSSGGAVGGPTSFTPDAATGCQKIDDPLAGLPAPAHGPCDHTDTVVDNGKIGGGVDDDDDGSSVGSVVTLSPGVYCGGLQVRSGRVELQSGTYVMRDGPLDVSSTAEMYGEDVSVYLTGDAAVFNLGGSSDVDITAPAFGPQAGVIFFEDRDAPLNRQHIISSGNVNNLEGTVYLPRGTLIVTGNGSIAENSAFTSVIANQIKVSESADLHLNADHDATNVPLAGDIGPVGWNVYLIK